MTPFAKAFGVSTNPGQSQSQSLGHYVGESGTPIGTGIVGDSPSLSRTPDLGDFEPAYSTGCLLVKLILAR